MSAGAGGRTTNEGPLDRPTLPDPPPAERTTELPVSVEVSATDREALLGLARKALAAATREVDPGELARALRDVVGCDRPAAVFVTLTEDDELRGCMGSLNADLPVGEAVVDAALAAALGDPRFRPLGASELAGVRVDVSVLSPPAALDHPDHLRPGVDGVIVRRGRAVALLLPEVAPRFGWGGRDLVEAACRKAGLPAAAWRDPDTRLSVFQTAHFGGPAIAEPSLGQELATPDEEAAARDDGAAVASEAGRQR